MMEFLGIQVDGRSMALDLAIHTALLAFVVALAAQCLAPKKGAKKVPEAAPAPASASSEAANYRIRVPGLAVLRASNEEMDWFEDVVNQIYAVTYGTKAFGDAGGDPIKPWAPGQFRVALFALREAVGDPWRGVPGGSRHEPLDDAVLSRLLIAANLDHRGAMDLVDRYVTYRASIGGASTLQLKHLEGGLATVPCEDRMGRPILLVRMRYHHKGDVEGFRRGMRAVLDTMVMHLLYKRKSNWDRDNPLEQYVMVVDLDHATLENFDWAGFKVLLAEGNFHYPNRLAQTYVLHAGAAFCWVYKMMKPLMHPRTARKTMIVGSRDVSACMRELVPEDRLPACYGGTARPWPQPKDARTLEDQCGQIAARVLLREGVAPRGAKPALGALSDAEREAAAAKAHDADGGGSDANQLLACCLCRTA